MCQAFIPLIGKNGRIVNLSSFGSSLSHYSPAIQARFRDPKLTLEELEILAQEYQVLIYPLSLATLCISFSEQTP
jgi:carbonyl reductase 1